MVDTLKPRCYTLNIAKALQNKTVAPFFVWQYHNARGRTKIAKGYVENGNAAIPKVCDAMGPRRRDHGIAYFFNVRRSNE